MKDRAETEEVPYPWIGLSFRKPPHTVELPS